MNENGDTLAIHKLTHNIPLTDGDYQELERVLTSELGSRQDYEREFGDTPFGLLIAGPVSEAAGVECWFWASGLLMVLAGGLCMAMTRRYDGGAERTGN